MRIFITGATGYIGRVVVEQAIAEGHSVRGLSGGDEGDPRLNTLGATPVRGELASVDLLSTESAAADAVFHLGFIHDFTRDFSEILQIDKTAVDALSEPLRGTDIQLVITSGTAAVTPDAAGGETTEESPLSEVFARRHRTESERHALRKSDDGVRVSSLRLPPYVYGRGGSYFLPLLIQMAAKSGESIYVGDGGLRTSDVHVDDAAALYLLAAKSAKPGRGLQRHRLDQRHVEGACDDRDSARRSCSLSQPRRGGNAVGTVSDVIRELGESSVEPETARAIGVAAEGRRHALGRSIGVISRDDGGASARGDLSPANRRLQNPRGRVATSGPFKQKSGSNAPAFLLV